MLRATGLTDRDLERPLVGVANTWIEIGPCNYHLRDLACHVKEGVRQAGGTPLEFNTISISDGITMGSEGMRASLVSREVIADSIELVARGNLFDCLVVLVGCDKTVPAAVMALARLDIPGLVLYGGLIEPGRWHDRDVTIQDVFEAVGAHAVGTVSTSELDALERQACPGAGACGGQFTANTMATVCECLGISPFGSASVPATDVGKADVAREAGSLVMDMLARDARPRQILTRQAIENAIAAVAATGGSTNAVLHLLAIAREAGVPLELADFDRISARVPLLADLKPGGRFVATDLHRAGGIPLVVKRLLEGGFLHGDAVTVTGRTIADHAAWRKRSACRSRSCGLSRIRWPASGGLVILSGNLAPDGAVVKVAGYAPGPHSGPARVFDSEELAFEAVSGGAIRPGDVVVIRHEGPSGGPGMREMLAVTAAIVGARPWRLGRARDGRTLLWRHARTDGRPCVTRGCAWWSNWRGGGRRSHHDRHCGPAVDYRPQRARGRGAPRQLHATTPAIRDGCHGQVRASRVVGVNGSHYLNRCDSFRRAVTSEGDCRRMWLRA